MLSGRLIEATDLCKEYIWAVLGRGYELFGMDSYLLPTSPPVCMPISTIDHLLSELSYLKDDDEVYGKVNLSKLFKYEFNCNKVTIENTINHILYILLLIMH